MINGFGSNLGRCEVGFLKTCSEVVSEAVVGGELEFNGQRHV